jgi:hypothetical protein
VREFLKEREGKRGRFSGTVKRLGSKPAYRGAPLPTLLLVDVRDEAGTLVTDHLWFTVRKQMMERNLKKWAAFLLRRLGCLSSRGFCKWPGSASAGAAQS